MSEKVGLRPLLAGYSGANQTQSITKPARRRHHKGRPTMDTKPLSPMAHPTHLALPILDATSVADRQRHGSGGTATPIRRAKACPQARPSADSRITKSNAGQRRRL